MIYALVGTDAQKRERALLELSKLGNPSVHIYAEQFNAVEPLIEASSLFGDRIVAHLIQTLEKADVRERLYDLLPSMKESSTVFIIDEPFADVHKVKKLEKYAEKVFDAREEKEEGASPFALANALARRDKKAVWSEWMHIRDTMEPEAIQGALWWKWQTVWSDVKSGRPSKFSLSECEQLGGRILRSSILAHRGKLDLKAELESIILSM